MPNAVLVALASASFTAASGAALTHIRSHRNPSAARLHGTSPLGKKRTHRHHRHGRTRASASPEIEALRVKPGWHPEGSPETRVKQLGYDLEGRCATNPAGVFYPVVLVGDLAYVSGQVPRNTDGSLIVGKCGDDMSDEDALLDEGMSESEPGTPDLNIAGFGHTQEIASPTPMGDRAQQILAYDSEEETQEAGEIDDDGEMEPGTP